jgi:hypothetical protein
LSIKQPVLGSNTLVGRQGNSSNLHETVDEAIQLSIKMCIADAVHDNTIIENVQNLLSRSLHLLSILAGQIHDIRDRVSLKKCQGTCNEIIQEVEKDILAVETEVVCQSEFATKSTVSSACVFVRPRSSCMNGQNTFRKFVSLYDMHD